MAEWIISGNPKKYDVINAFRDLGTIDWMQSANMEVGDIVYIYVSGDVKSICFRCRVNAVDLEEVTIDDSEYDVSGEFDGSAGRYMTLEMLEEYEGNEFTREELMKCGFSSPLGPVHLTDSVKNYLEKVANAAVINKRFSVNESIWIAAAAKAYFAYKKNKDFGIEDCILTATEIQKRASEYTDNTVQSARIHQHCNGDHENCTHRFLRRIGKNNNNVDFRVAAKGEFNDDKYIPGDLKWNEKIVVDGEGVVLKELRYFIDGPYREKVVATMPIHISDEDALWVVAACMTYNACLRKKEKFNAEDVFFESEKIIENTTNAFGLNLTNDTLDRITALMNNDSIHFMVSASGKRRISYMNEFKCVNECPSMEVINSLPQFEVEGKVYDFKYVYSFVNREYTERARVLFKKVDIDYLGLLDYLEKNRNIPYSNPESAKSTAEKEAMLEIKKKGQYAQAIMKQIVEVCQSVTKLDRCEPMSWLDGSNTKTRNYLWAQMKYSKYAKHPASVSLFVEAKEDKAYFRISLEIKNDNASKEEMKKYHSHMDMSLHESDGLVYVAGSNEWGNPAEITGSQAEIKEKINAGEYKKVQLCKFINQKAGQTSDYFENEILAAVKAIIPYYEYVIGANENEYWPSLSEYDPGITAEEYESILMNESLVSKHWLDILYYLYKMDGVGSCKQITNKYGNKAAHYNTNGINIAKAVAKETGCPLSKRETGEERYWPVLFYGKDITGNSDEGTFLYKMREPLMEAINSMDERGEFQDMNKTQKTEFDKNLILYGPPGTGKTYNSAIYAVAICDGVSVESLSDYDAVMDRYNQLKAEHRIAFTTFHQSYGYEEFIEGIKPIVGEESKEVSYTIESGVFKRFCEIARCPSNIKVDPNAQIWFMRLEDNAKVRKDECFANAELTIEIKEDDEWSKERFVDSMQVGDYVLSYAGNSIYIDAIGVIEGEATFDENRKVYQWFRKVKWHILPEKIDVKAINDDTYLPNFSIAKMNHMKLSDLLRLLPQETEVDDKPYVFIIDEINRGNISKIFGELITLIENTKREGAPEAASAILPYSGQAFSVPSNVYILGTMNTADRSIALMDTALRRRFQFKEMMPDTEVLIKIGADKINQAGIELNVASMLETINDRIEYLFDREHTIGHAFFTGLKDEPTVDKLASIFKKSVIPLLQEYFYEDYSKIMLVLGDNGKPKDSQKFIIAKEIKPNLIFRGDTSDIDIPDYAYEIQEDAFYDIMSYIEITG